ncbi:MAG: T9SS type A sorting domain-containing protein [Bacteroidota bacterium]|nr:T9SS type A sorting domain-containing protein [Bacteroidota bacterium]
MKKILFSLLFAVSSITAVSQTGLHFQWHKGGVYGTPFLYDKDTLINICRVGYNVSNPNTIGMLNPNTSTWNYMTSPISPSVYPTVMMKDRMNGAIYTNTNNFYITTDGWQTSTLHTTLTTLPYDATKFGYVSYTTPSPYNLQFSSNGITWTSVTTITSTPYFVKSDNKLFVLDGNKLLTSTNGGSSYSTTTYTSSFGSAKLYAANDDTLFAAGTNSFYASFDGGATWNTGSMPSPTLQVITLACKNGKELMLHLTTPNLSQKSFYYSNNSGTTWTLITTPIIPSGDELYATRKYFMIYPTYRSVDGTNWTQDVYPKVKTGAMDLDFRGNVGLVGFEDGYFAYSDNKGASFKIFSTQLGAAEDIMAVKVLPGNKFIVGDRKGSIFESSDLGQTWVTRYSNTVSNLNAQKIMYSQNTNTIVCVRAGQPLMSVNGGSSYVVVNVGGGSHTQAQKPVSGDMIDVGGLYTAPNYTLSAWEINKVSNSGTKTLLSTITPTGNLATEYILALHMTNDNIGYFISRNTSPFQMQIYKTTDGWQTVAQVSTVSGGFSSAKVQTLGMDTVIISGGGNGWGALYFLSTNGGLSWNTVTTNFTNPNANLGSRIYRAHFFNTSEFMALIGDLNGTAALSVGAYLNTNGTGGSSSVGIKEVKLTSVANHVSVYPNPASSGVTIKSENEFTRIEIYDLSGKLVSEKNSEPLFQLQVETESLNNGIYLVKIYSEKGIAASGKLIIAGK